MVPPDAGDGFSPKDALSMLHIVTFHHHLGECQVMFVT
jgi:hypothetical protein